MMQRGMGWALLLLGGMGWSGLVGAEWRILSAEAGRRIEIDMASIQQGADGNIQATGRMVLDKEIVDIKSGELYKAIQGTTRYDCIQRTAMTLKRAFLRADDQVLREEEEKAPPILPVRSGTLDYRVMREVCRPPGTRGEAMKVAEKATDAAVALRQANEAMLQKQLHPVAPPRQAAATPVHRVEVRSRRAQAAPAAPIQASAPPRALIWSYQGAGGPDHWAEIKSEYSRCSQGQRQSPIDIRDGIQVDLEPILFDYHPSLFTIVNTGYSVEARVGGNRLSLLGKTYVLERIRFHRPGEVAVDGQRFDMGVHLEHLAADGERLILAVMLKKGAENPLIQTLWNYLPLEKRQEVSPPSASIDPDQLLPASRGYHTFMGSLTQPPCTEGVLWVVMQVPVALSPDQEAIFARLYPDNARPLQPGNARLIKSSRPIVTR